MGEENLDPWFDEEGEHSSREVHRFYENQIKVPDKILECEWSSYRNETKVNVKKGTHFIKKVDPLTEISIIKGGKVIEKMENINPSATMILSFPIIAKEGDFIIYKDICEHTHRT